MKRADLLKYLIRSSEGEYSIKYARSIEALKLPKGYKATKCEVSK